jgi:hypothetical protein
MRDDVILLKAAIEVRLLQLGLSQQLVPVGPLGLFESVSEELHVVPGPANVFFNFLPHHVVYEILVPNALLLDA